MSKIKLNMDSLQAKKTWTRHKVADGHNVYRVLPPFGESSNGYPYRKWQVTWGLNDPSTGMKKPFASCISQEGSCPILEYVDALSKKAEDMKAKLKNKGLSDEAIKEQLKEINAVISNVKPKTTYAYNAINKSGQVGLLEIKSTAHKKLKALMMEYIKDYNQDPTSLNSSDDDSGVWFDFIRTGTMYQTEYDVKKNQTKTKIGASFSFVDDREALPDSVVQSYENSAYDLSTIYKISSYNDLRSILMSNLKGLVAANPDLAVPGFDDFSNVEDMAAADATQPTVVRTADTASKPTAGTKKVQLKFDADEDDEIQTIKSTNGLQGKNAAVASSDDDDIMNLANSILNG